MITWSTTFNFVGISMRHSQCLPDATKSSYRYCYSFHESARSYNECISHNETIDVHFNPISKGFPYQRDSYRMYKSQWSDIPSARPFIFTKTFCRQPCATLNPFTYWQDSHSFGEMSYRNRTSTESHTITKTHAYHRDPSPSSLSLTEDLLSARLMTFSVMFHQAPSCLIESERHKPFAKTFLRAPKDNPKTSIGVTYDFH